MFESVKHWFDSLDEQSPLFVDPTDAVLHSALASVLYHLINADNVITKKEKSEFFSILKHEFNLNDEQTNYLYEAAKSSTSVLLDDLKIVSHYLKQDPTVHLAFMQKLNHLMGIDGVKYRELDIFYEALRLVFPEVNG